MKKMMVKEKKDVTVTEGGRNVSGRKEEGRKEGRRKEGRKGFWKEGGFTAGSQVVAGHSRTISTWRPVPPRFSSLSSDAYERYPPLIFFAFFFFFFFF